MPIKVIKRKDAEAAITGNIHSPLLGEQSSVTLSHGEETTARRVQRGIAEAIAKWIPEFRSSNLLAEIDDRRRFYGGDQTLSEI